MNRRVLLRAAVVSGVAAYISFPAWTEDKTTDLKVAKVPSGQDRLKDDAEHDIGVSHTTFKVLSAETGGNLFVIEQAIARGADRRDTFTTTKRSTSTSSKATTSLRWVRNASNWAPAIPCSCRVKSRMHGGSSATRDAFSFRLLQPARWKRGSGL